MLQRVFCTKNQTAPLTIVATFLLSFVLADFPCLADEGWLRFRGPNGTGVSDLKGVPTEWSENDYEWVISLPGTGHSSPIITGDSLFVTSGESDGTRRIFCVDALTGERRWSDVIKLGQNHLHKKNCYCSGTPATDGERVFVAEADSEHFIVTGFKITGEKLWTRDLGPFLSQHGFGLSPILYEGKVIVPNDHDGSGQILALDALTGETVWNAKRDSNVASYSTPMVINLKGQDQLIVLSDATGLGGLNPVNGKQLWNSGKLPQRTVASPVYGNGLLVATCGSGGRGQFMVVVDPLAAGEKEAAIKAERKKLLPYVPTPIVQGQYLYLWNDDGTVCCVDMQGDLTDCVWKERIGGNYSGSPVLIDGKIYCISEEGIVNVVDASPVFRKYPGGKLGDSSYSTPAIANGRLYLKGFEKLASLKSNVPVADAGRPQE